MEHGGGRRRWLLAQGAELTWRRFRDDWRALPDPARRRFAWTITGGLAFSFALMAAQCLVGMRMEEAGGLAWEGPVLARLDALEAMSFSTALWAESPGNSVFMIPVVLLAALLCAWERRPLRALAVLASFFVLDLIVLLGWLTWDRARPRLIEGGIASPGFHSFPSGHVAQMVSAYGLFVWFWVRASRSRVERILAIALWLAVVATVALARLRLGSHWPTDVAAGALIGGVWLGITILALRRGEAAGGR